jgi:methyl-accepting chemotaxis protein
MDAKFLRQISIQGRLYLLIVIVAVTSLIPLVIAINDYQRELIEAKKTKTRHLVESSYSVIEHYHKLHQSGALTLQAAQEAAKSAISNQRYESVDYFWINDLTPTMIMHPIKPALDGQDISKVADPTGKLLFIEMVEVAKNAGQGYVNYMWPKPGHEEPIEKVSYIKLFKPWGWILGTGVYVDDINALIMVVIKKTMISVALSLVFMLLMATLLSSSIVRPCKNTLDALRDIAEGDGDLTHKLPEQGNDELSQIAQAFNKFAEKLRVIIADIQPIAIDISNSAIELNQVAQNSSSKALQQHQAVDTVASAMNQLHASNQEVANSAQSAADAAKVANEQGLHGSAVIEEASNFMHSLSDRLTDTDTNIQQLAEETQEVGSVLEVIRGVAEQTNLLALNAAIEAARAGEHGRGFAVVADEVRTLATRTQKSTDEIEQIITKLQAQAKEVSVSMVQTKQQSQVTLERAEDAKQALIEIGTQVNNILSQNEHIAQASSQQTLATDEISQNLTQIADHGQQSTEQASHVANTSESLLNSGHTLSENLASFKVQ